MDFSTPEQLVQHDVAKHPRRCGRVDVKDGEQTQLNERTHDGQLAEPPEVPGEGRRR